MAECEALAVASSALTVQVVNTTPVKPEPKIKPMRTNGNNNAPQPPKPPPTSPTSGANEQQDAQRSTGDKKDVPCKFFGKTYRGCARTSRCPFLHSWDGLEKEKTSRCLACGGKHMVKDCPNKKGGSPTANGTPRTPQTPRPG